MSAQASIIRAVLIRLLWVAVADDESCDGNCEVDGEPFAICEGMRALGFGDHFDSHTFQRRALDERLPCEGCKRLARRVRCAGCGRLLCEPCLALPGCERVDSGVHQEATP